MATNLNTVNILRIQPPGWCLQNRNKVVDRSLFSIHYDFSKCNSDSKVKNKLLPQLEIVKIF